MAGTRTSSGSLAPELVHVGNRTLLGHAVNALAGAGVEQIAVVVPGAARDNVCGALDRDAATTRVELIDAGDTGGTPGALLATERFVADDPFVLHSGDGLLRHDLRSLVADAAGGRADALLLVYRNGLDSATQLEGHRVMRLFDGELRGQTDLSLAGAHAFGAGVLARLRPRLAAVPDGDVATVAEHARAAGLRLEAQVVEAWCRYAGDARDLLTLNRAVLDDLEVGAPPVPPPGCSIDGRVQIHPTALVRGSVIRGPAVIGAGARVLDAYIGPYTSIGDGTVVENCEIENSILLGGARLQNVAGRLDRSVLGYGARVHRDFSLPVALRVLAADGIDLALP